MDSGTREFVRIRACGRCEYCGIPQYSVAFPFQIELIIAREHSGSDEPSNLALACERCNAYKGTNLSAIDPSSGDIVAIFHPRKDLWHHHFELRSAYIVGLSNVGRATAKLLNMNAANRVALRVEIGQDAAPPTSGAN